MNRKFLGEQIHGHLQLYKDIGVRYMTKAPVAKPQASPVSQKARSVSAGSGIPQQAAKPVRPETGRATEPLKPVEPIKSPVVNEAVKSPKMETTHTFVTPLAESVETLDAIRAAIGDCKRCKLAPTRTNLVFGSGHPHAALMFVGEAPGADEDEQGLPFVGRAGMLLTRIIESVEIRREDVFICNILKCRPPGNRNPEPDEIAACEGFLFRQIAAVRPKALVALGAFGAQTLLRSTESIGRLRGRMLDYRGIKLMATYHPAYLLRNPIEKRKVWEDMLIVRNYLKTI